MTVMRDGAAARQLSPFTNRDESAHWSPDGALLAFDSFRSGEQQLWIANPDGTGARPFVVSNFVTFLPSWNPRSTSNVALPAVATVSGAPRIAPSAALLRADRSAAALTRNRCRVIRQGSAWTAAAKSRRRSRARPTSYDERVPRLRYINSLRSSSSLSARTASQGMYWSGAAR